MKRLTALILTLLILLPAVAACTKDADKPDAQTSGNGTTTGDTTVGDTTVGGTTAEDTTTGDTTVADTTADNTTDETTAEPVAPDTIPVLDRDGKINVSIFWEPAFADEHDGQQISGATEEQYRLMVEAGITRVELTNHETGFNLPGSVEKSLELCRKLGLEMTVQSKTTMNFLNMSDAQIKEYVSQYADDDTVVGYYLVDEPVNPAAYGRVYRVVLDADPDAIPVINLLPWWATMHFESYGGYVEDSIINIGADLYKEICYDEYPFPYTRNKKAVEMFTNLELIRKIGLKYNINTACYLQACGSPGSFRKLNEGEMRYETAASLAYGFKGYKYFTWWSPFFCAEADYGIISPYGEPTELYNGVKQVNSEVAKVSSTLANLDAYYIYHTNPVEQSTVVLLDNSVIKPVDGGVKLIVSYMKHRSTGRDYIMLVNKNYSGSETVEFDISGINYLYDVTGGEYVPVDISSGKVSFEFKAGGFVLLAVGAEDTLIGNKYDLDEQNIAYNKPVFTDNTYSRNGFYAFAINDGLTDSEANPTAKGWKADGEAYIGVDLLRVTKINRVDLYPVGNKFTLGEKFPLTFKVEVSTDGIGYTEVISKTSYTDATDAVPSFTFDAVDARYVRVTVADGGEISEMRIFNDDGSIPAPPTDIYAHAGNEPAGANVAVGKPVTVSSSTETAQYGWGVALVNDGIIGKTAKKGMGWTSKTNLHPTPDAEEWIIIDLAAEYVLDRVVLYPRQDSGECFPEQYSVLVSADGETYTVAATVTDSAPDTTDAREVSLDGIYARYVKIVGTKLRTTKGGSEGYIMQFSEIEIYNK